MLAALLDAPLHNRASPQQEPGKVLSQANAATCGTDLKTFRRGHPVLFQRTPAAFGHEVAGPVTATSSGVTQYKEDNAVFIAAALTEALHCALHGTKASNIGAGDTVAIPGTGPIGLLFIGQSNQLCADSVCVSADADLSSKPSVMIWL
jgi:threonine dehydrogenase-like Zn-dependent dehydrogenase